jgi:peptide-methionine (S)-S-oxide reductase
MQTATLAGGCFWCTEAVFKRLKGIISVVPGYSGGNVVNPSYEQVSSGNTGHAETIQIQFDPKILSFDNILDIFFHTHDPTTINQQGNDVGPQYRSVIFYHDENQKNEAQNYIKKLEENKEFKKPIVTEIVPFTNFYEAENYHKNYYENHKNNLYCDLTIAPKITKLLQKYGTMVKDECLE